MEKRDQQKKTGQRLDRPVNYRSCGIYFSALELVHAQRDILPCSATYFVHTPESEQYLFYGDTALYRSGDNIGHHDVIISGTEMTHTGRGSEKTLDWPKHYAGWRKRKKKKSFWDTQLRGTGCCRRSQEPSTGGGLGRKSYSCEANSGCKGILSSSILDTCPVS